MALAGQAGALQCRCRSAGGSAHAGDRPGEHEACTDDRLAGAGQSGLCLLRSAPAPDGGALRKAAAPDPEEIKTARDLKSRAVLLLENICSVISAGGEVGAQTLGHIADGHGLEPDMTRSGDCLLYTSGVIAEFDPFHLGHAYLLTSIRRSLGPETAVVAVMSGCFTQRGGAAVCTPQARSEMALRNGADLVLELPVSFAAASAERFRCV